MTYFRSSKKILLAGILLISLFCIANSPKYMFYVGNIFFGKYDALYNVTLAQFFFERAAHPIIGNPYPYAHHQLSRTYFIQGKLMLSLNAIDTELRLYPTHTESYYIKGLTLGYMNKEEEAIEAFDIYIQNTPHTWAARNDKAWLEFRIGKIDDALLTIEPVAHLTTNPWVQNTYGALLMNKGKNTEAKIAFSHAWEVVKNIDEKKWGKAYPGNDPRIYQTGLKAMRKSIESNLEIVKNK